MTAVAFDENSFSAVLAGRTFRFRAQSAAQQLGLSAKAGEVLSRLTGCAMEVGGLYALACNCVLLAQVLVGEDAPASPCDVLDRFSLSQIADLARLYFEHMRTADQDEFEEGAVSESFCTASAAL
ncbi:hypothetical protein V6615_05685 [Oscillospiraceae bacterium PP1C4]